MNLGKSLVSLATAPVRVGLAAADAGLGVATSALGLAHRTLGEPGTTSRSNAVVHMLGIDDAITRANRLARLLDDDAPMGRALATDGPIDRLLRPGGVVDLLTQSGGLLDRLTAEGGGLERALQRGGLVDQLVADDAAGERQQLRMAAQINGKRHLVYGAGASQVGDQRPRTSVVVQVSAGPEWLSNLQRAGKADAVIDYRDNGALASASE